jgi:hypothetical protein
MTAVCSRCVEDEYLKEIILNQGEVQECTLCEREDGKAFTTEDLAMVIAPIITEHFKQGEDVKRFGADDSEWWEQEGDPLAEHIQEVIGQYLGFEDEIVSALEDNEGYDPRDGDGRFFDSSCNYVSIPTRPFRYLEEWNYALDELKHRRRFFNTAANTLFTELFDGVETRRVWSKNNAQENVVWELPEGSEIFRARTCHSSKS